MADAHPQGAKPFARADYIAKFETLAAQSLSVVERERFVALAVSAGTLDAAAVMRLLPVADPAALGSVLREKDGIF